MEARLFIRDHYQRLVEQANRQAAQYERNEMDELLASMNRGTITDPAAHAEARQRAVEVEALRDSDANAMAAAFLRDKADTFSKLARYETSLERSLYKALHELQCVQAARAARAVLAPVAVDVNVDTGLEPG